MTDKHVEDREAAIFEAFTLAGLLLRAIENSGGGKSNGAIKGANLEIVTSAAHMLQERLTEVYRATPVF